MTHEELYARWKALDDEKAALEHVQSKVRDAAYELELRLFEMEGRGHLARAEWIRAFLANDHSRCSKVMCSAEYDAELRAGENRHAPPAATIPEAA